MRLREMEEERGNGGRSVAQSAPKVFDHSPHFLPMFLVSDFIQSLQVDAQSTLHTEACATQEDVRRGPVMRITEVPHAAETIYV